ncbi:MAG: 50S ribosomal protein L22 [Patescibacteria group bacterium]
MTEVKQENKQEGKPEIKATLNFLKMGPRKVRLIADSMRGHKVSLVLERLTMNSQHAALPMLKLLKSAVANAKHNYKFDVGTLRVKSITVDGGPVVKRWMPKAHGRATPLRQRTSHINLVLVHEEPLAKKVKSARGGSAFGGKAVKKTSKK